MNFFGRLIFGAQNANLLFYFGVKSFFPSFASVALPGFAVIAKNSEKYGIRKRISGEVYNFFENYDWPGNVRELQNVIERILILNDSDVIRIEHIPSDILIKAQVISKSKIKIEGILPLLEAKEHVERELIEKAIDSKGSVREAAKLLGIDHSTCIRKMQKYGLRSKLKVYQESL